MPKGKTKVKPNVDAIQAMQEAVHRSQDVVVLKLDPETRRYLEVFLKAFEEVRPDTPFSVLDVMRWAHKYQAIIEPKEGNVGFRLPSIFYNAYTLGKLLKKSQEELGYLHAGSYGNRSIYSIGGKADA